MTGQEFWPFSLRMNESGIEEMDEDKSRELEKEIAYYRRKIDELDGHIIRHDYSNLRMRNELKKNRKALEVMRKLYSKMGKANKAGDVFNLLLKTIIQEIDMDRAIILNSPGSEGKIIAAAWLGYKREEIIEMEKQLSECLNEFSEVWKSPVVASSRTHPDPFGQALRAILAIPFFVWIPVISGGEVLAIIIGGNMKEDRLFRQPLEKSDLEIFQSISGMVAVALRNIYFRSTIIESETKYRSLIESMRELVWEVDEHGRILFMGPLSEELLGFTPEELLGKNIYELSPIRDELQEHFRAIVRDKKPLIEYEHPFCHRNGSVVWFEANVCPVFDENGDITAYRAMCRDIMERKRADEALRLQHYTRTVIETSPDPIFVISLDGHIMDVNAAAAMVTEKNRALLLGMKFSHYFTDGERAENFISAAFTEGHIRDFELVMKTASGESTVFLYNASVFKNQEERIAGVIAVARDITRLKKAKDELERERNYSRFLIDKAHDGILVWESPKSSFRFSIILWNEEMKKITGYSIDEIQGRDFTSLLIKDSNIRKSAVNRIKRALQMRKFPPMEWTIQTKEGKAVTVSTTSSVVFESEDTLQVLTIVRDVTGEKELREQLFQVEKLSSIGKMVAGIAHEINNPLTGVMGFSQMICFSSDVSREIRDLASMIYNESERARKVVGDLLIFARKHKPEIGPCDITGIILDVLKVREGDMERSNISLEKKLNQRGSVIVMGDRHQLFQVILNIVNNAIDALSEVDRERKICISSELVKKRVRLTFYDNGCGIDEQLQPDIFDPFFTTKGIGRGTGLGLSISYGIVKEHRGKIHLKSIPGQETTFFLELPVMQREETPEDAPAMDRASLTDRRFGGKKVLVIDDEVVILKLLRKYLESREILVDTVENGIDGLKKMKEGDYDVIFCDFALPGIDGKRIYEESQIHFPHLLPRLIFMTGDIKDSTRTFFEEMNIRPILKPFDIVTIKEVLEENL